MPASRFVTLDYPSSSKAPSDFKGEYACQQVCNLRLTLRMPIFVIALKGLMLASRFVTINSHLREWIGCTLKGNMPASRFEIVMFEKKAKTLKDAPMGIAVRSWLKMAQL